MSVLPLVIAPDPRLNTESEAVDTVTDEIRTLAADMFDTMYANKGIGLAAVQVGVMQKLLVADVEWKEGETGTQHVLINAEIIEEAPELTPYKEGCLSFPDQFSDVDRPKEVRVRYMDLEGKTREDTFTDLLGTCIQHEIDHTNGITFVDHISRLKRTMILKKLEKGKKQGLYGEHACGEHCDH